MGTSILFLLVGFISSMIFASHIDPYLMESVFKEVNEELNWMKNADEEFIGGHARTTPTKEIREILHWNELLRSATEKLSKLTGQEEESVREQLIAKSRHGGGGGRGGQSGQGGRGGRSGHGGSQNQGGNQNFPPQGGNQGPRPQGGNQGPRPQGPGQNSSPNSNFGLPDVCRGESVIPCNSSEISSIFPPFGGRCNNINFPLLGTPGRPSRRLLHPCIRNIVNTRDNLLSTGRDGRDGQNNRPPGERPRGCDSNPGSLVVNPNFPTVCPGTILPNPRLVSTTFHPDTDVANPNVNQLFTMFGQFVDHDLTLTTTQLLPNGKTCCDPEFINNLSLCLNIIIPYGDPFFPAGKCLVFPRSAKFCSAAPNNCNDDNIAALTAYVDANTIYSQDYVNSIKIREKVGGRLLTSDGNLLPRIPAGTGPFTAGEGRVRENPALATVHTIFLREHNRIANQVARINPFLSDDDIFAHTRRIVIAELQSIIFGEFLPLLIGSERKMNERQGGRSGRNGKAGPRPKQEPDSRTTIYDPNTDPSIINEFASAAFRFGHTTVNGLFNKVEPVSGIFLHSYLLRFSLNNEDLYSAYMGSIAKGMTTQSAQTFDNFITQELTNFLYASPSDGFLFGSDLAARNIQRARDNNLGGWANYRRLCVGDGPFSWNDKPSDISQKKWNTLMTLYYDVNDIDLFAGLLAERPEDNSVLGRTAACIVKQQFNNVRSGDRYFFSHINGASGFTSRQVKDLKNVKMFDILCLNTNISQLQERAFENIQGNNQLVSCSRAQGINVNGFF